MDQRFDRAPWGLIIGLVLGAAVSVRLLWEIVRQLNRNDDGSSERD